MNSSREIRCHVCRQCKNENNIKSAIFSRLVLLNSHVIHNSMSTMIHKSDSVFATARMDEGSIITHPV